MRRSSQYELVTTRPSSKCVERDVTLEGASCNTDLFLILFSKSGWTWMNVILFCLFHTSAMSLRCYLLVLFSYIFQNTADKLPTLTINLYMAKDHLTSYQFPLPNKMKENMCYNSPHCQYSNIFVNCK